MAVEVRIQIILYIKSVLLGDRVSVSSICTWDMNDSWWIYIKKLEEFEMFIMFDDDDTC